MASYVWCLSIFILALSIYPQINARESKFFSKVSKTTTKTQDSISISPAISQSLPPAPAPEPEVIVHGYGLYGRDPYENTHEDTVKPSEKPVFGEEKYVPAEELYKENTRENFETYPSTSQTHRETPMGSGEKQGMSDTRFLENGKYYYDVNQDGKDVSSYVENEGNENENENENEKGYVLDKEGLSEATYRNVNGNGREKQGMSDTRFLENGKYYYDVNKDGVTDVTSFVENEDNVNGRNHEYVQGKQGLSDTRYNSDVQNGDEDNFNNNENEQFEQDPTRFSHNANENHNNLYNSNNNINWNEGNYGSTKKLQNEYDTMEEYDREQGYVDPQVGYVP